MKSTATPAHMNDTETRRLAVAFALLATCTYALIVLGALVRAHHAGLACPDWPLCFGQLIPEFNIKVAFEWSHRLMAGTVALVFLGLSWRTLRIPVQRSRMAKLLAITAALLALQIVLGGLTVLQLLASWSVTSHLVTGNGFALCLVIASRTLFEDPHAPPDAQRSIRPGLRLFVTACAILLLGQLVLGGLVSSNYAGLLCPDWPSCENGVFLPSFEGRIGLHILHRLTAYGLLLALLGAQLASHFDAAERGSVLFRLLTLALALCLVQVGVGIANVLLRLPVEVTGAHTGLAAVLMLCLGLALREAWRRPLASMS
jgi:cytochrome c oxidase assembly protein subunit 15